MGSIDIDRDKYPGKSDTQIAEIIAKQYGYIVVVRYKSRGATMYTNFGLCKMEEEINGYLSSPYCNDVEIIYDGRTSAFSITEELILNGNCELCGKQTTRESLQLMAGNDFYICTKCGLMFCDGCYIRLPLTSSPGYGTCPTCRIEVQRAIPGFFGKQSGTSTNVEDSKESVEPDTLSEQILKEDDTLHSVVIEGNQEKVRALIARGDNLEEMDNDGATPLYYAAYMAFAEIAKILIQSGAKVEAQNAKGETPLHEVAGHLHREGDETTIKVLLDAGASLNARDNDGATPLHSAAIGGHFEAASILLERGADIQARSQQLTPLHFSAYAGKPEVTKLLIEHGADVFAEKDGMTPLYMAQQPSQSSESNKQRVIQLLEQAMARGKHGQQNMSDRRSSPAKPEDKQWWQFWK